MDEEPTGPGIGSFFATIPTILWERKWWIIIPAVLGLIAAVAATLLIKPTYQSSALMIVQSPQIQGKVFSDLNNEVVDRRIARIREEIVSRPNSGIADRTPSFVHKRSRVQAAFDRD